MPKRVVRQVRRPQEAMRPEPKAPELLLRDAGFGGNERYPNAGYAVIRCTERDCETFECLKLVEDYSDEQIMTIMRKRGWLFTGSLHRKICPTCAPIVKARYAQPEQEPQVEEKPNQPIQNSIF